jgi:hypothetical protein
MSIKGSLQFKEATSESSGVGKKKLSDFESEELMIDEGGENSIMSSPQGSPSKTN